MGLAVRPLRRALAALALVLGVASAQSVWQRLEADGLHDPNGPGIGLLQQPAEALSQLPPDTAGNMVRWVRAIDEGVINPRTNLRPETEVRVRNDAFFISRNGSMPAVLFPHRQHTLWLDCTNCHDQLFKPQAGANKFSMAAILNGEQCGLCHGAVAFPLTECTRCHSVSNALLQRATAALRAASAAAPKAPAGAASGP